MIIDTSAFIELFASGSSATRIAEALTKSNDLKVSSVSVLETAALIRRQHGRAGVDQFLEFIIQHKIQIIPFDGDQLLAALLGEAAYGEGTDSGTHVGSNLRLAELCTYGLAKSGNEPVLHTNKNLRRTDLEDA